MVALGRTLVHSLVMRCCMLMMSWHPCRSTKSRANAMLMAAHGHCAISDTSIGAIRSVMSTSRCVWLFSLLTFCSSRSKYSFEFMHGRRTQPC